MTKAIDKVRAFANVESGVDNMSKYVDNLSKIELALAGDGSGAPEGSVDFDDVQGLDPTMPIAASLSELEDEIVSVVSAVEVPNQFANDRVGASPIACEFVFQMRDGRFYRAVSSNQKALRDGELFRKLFLKFESINASILGITVKGQANKAYGFGPVKRLT